MTSSDGPAGELLVDCRALTQNYRHCAGLAASAETAAVVKADAYGLGMEPVARTLAAAGCKTFFVALAAEGAGLRTVLPDAVIYVMNGLMPGSAAVLADNALRPCLSDLTEIAEWSAVCRKRGERLPAAIHIDTGINRIGLPESDLTLIPADDLKAFETTLVMSHLSDADTPDHPMNERQRETFDRLRRCMPEAPASLANTGGILLGEAFHLNVVRPGIGLYGGGPSLDRPHPFVPVVHFSAPVIQVRRVAAGEAVGYGGLFRPARDSRIALIAAGYADGIPRTSTGGRVRIAGADAPIVGRVSMDMLAADISDLPDGAVSRGDLAELAGPHIGVDDLGRAAGTIGYEILAHLGKRTRRRYAGAPDSPHKTRPLSA